MSLRICYKNVVKMMWTYHFSKKKKEKWQLICGNGIAEIEGGKIVGMNMWQWHCQNRREKKLLKLVYGNSIAEIEGKKTVGMNLWQ